MAAICRELLLAIVNNTAWQGRTYSKPYTESKQTSNFVFNIVPVDGLSPFNDRACIGIYTRSIHEGSIDLPTNIYNFFNKQHWPT